MVFSSDSVIPVTGEDYNWDSILIDSKFSSWPSPPAKDLFGKQASPLDTDTRH